MEIEPASAADDSKYLIHSRTEIAHVLRAIMQKNELVTAYFNHGHDFILTSIVEVDPGLGAVIVDCGANDALNKKILDSEKIIFVTTQDRVKVQFVADKIESIQHNKRNAFRVKLPATLLKLQKREFYRLSTPVINPIKCIIPTTRHGRVNVSIADISIGGIGIVGYPPEVEFEPGQVYDGCRIDLPDIGTVTVSMEIKSAFEITLKNGSKTKRCGCEFINIPSSMQAMIQRYIIKLERERRAKLADG
jgi:c-di-GMP-binding flagellar brake protein YcgR